MGQRDKGGLGDQVVIGVVRGTWVVRVFEVVLVFGVVGVVGVLTDQNVIIDTLDLLFENIAYTGFLSPLSCVFVITV